MPERSDPHHERDRWYTERLPMIHGRVFDVRTGQLKDLGLNMEREFMAIRKVYDLKPKN
ncbi:MAG TPA: hypothetical protein PKE21_11860 [Flavobacteriales bacterium]|nr:hypothetical protein [Flavobacteriales bacterium]HMR28167.1 hypothetical protein [Flavobacteriales bacterium]